MFSFGKKLTPEEQAKKWKRELNREIRGLERSIRTLSIQEKKTTTEIKQLAKKGQTPSIRPLAKELLHIRKTKEQLYSSKSTMNSVALQLQTQMATLKIAKVMEKSTAVLTSMNKLIKLPEISQTMREMAREMEKAGLIDEMVQDTLETLEDEGIEEEADEEITKVITELTADILEQAQTAPTTTLPTQVARAEQDEELQSMKARLEAL